MAGSLCNEQGRGCPSLPALCIFGDSARWAYTEGQSHVTQLRWVLGTRILLADAELGRGRNGAGRGSEVQPNPDCLTGDGELMRSQAQDEHPP